MLATYIPSNFSPSEITQQSFFFLQFFSSLAVCNRFQRVGWLGQRVSPLVWFFTSTANGLLKELSYWQWCQKCMNVPIFLMSHKLCFIYICIHSVSSVQSLRCVRLNSHKWLLTIFFFISLIWSGPFPYRHICNYFLMWKPVLILCSLIFLGLSAVVIHIFQNKLV